ncbi:serine/threonine protein kinase [Antricoccus suffuscus]|uniref:Serine/threonine protein kinase n=2 Tax=Antricoccus suffuscus TaxID=1629062 RepID=A0A2T1A4P3_9ACTN|nr:serine/threonine protein kinase [Antricoccus suffuscus]
MGPYRVIKKVGSGGMGIVYLGADPTDKPVAIKVLREHIAEDPAARSRLRRELDTLRRVRHRCVAGVVDADLENDPAYIVTEFISGPQLDTYIDDVGPLSRPGLVNLGHGLSGALDAIHDVDVVHRDLKPGNILLFEERPVVIDFGIAQLADDVRLTVTGLFVGTPGYVAPEVIAGARSTPATDWWGWAATLAFAATGRPPAGKGPIEVVLDRISRGRLDLEGIDEDLTPLLVDCLHPDPAARPGAAEIKTRFGRFAAGQSTADERRTAMAHPDVRPPGPARSTGDMAPRQPTALLDRPAPIVAPHTSPPHTNPPHTNPPPVNRPPNAGPATPYLEPPPPEPTTPPPAPYGRTGTIAAYALLLIAVTAAIPFVGAGVALLSAAVARFVDGSVESMHWRRSFNGPKRSNIVKEIVASPWRMVTSCVLAVGSMLVPYAVATGLIFAASQSIHRSGGRFDQYIQNAVIGIAMAIAMLIAWWGPGGASLRRASRRTANVFAPGSFGAVVCVTVFVLGAAFIGILVLSFPSLSWWPLLDGPLSFT